MVTILGLNLGKNYDDISSGVEVAGVPCRPVENLYKAAVEIVCETGFSDSIRTGEVEVTINNGIHATSEEKFSYVVSIKQWNSIQILVFIKYIACVTSCAFKLWAFSNFV